MDGKGRQMMFRVALFALLVIGGCATVPAPPREQLFDDHLFAAPSQRISADDVFAASPQMKDYIATKIAAAAESRGPKWGLFDALYSKHELRLEYETTITRNAAQAFAARAGNCLSLVIMTAAFAKQMGLAVTYQQGYVDETWSRSGDLYLSIGHVNLTLESRYVRSPLDSENLTIDFLPPEDIRGLRSRVIGESTIVAMYMNNRAVESMAAGKLDDAYWWAREAIAQDPTFVSSYNTLGAIYERSGHFERAERALRYVLASNPKNTHAMSNLVSVLERAGRTAEANELARRLAELEPDPPFSFFDRGVLAMRAGHYAVARDLFLKEVNRAPYYHEFHYWLAAAYAALGDYDRAREQMEFAIEYSPTRGDRALYAAKLARIDAHVAR
jgi:tetratricopeptide (TPR) repeat protein